MNALPVKFSLDKEMYMYQLRSPGTTHVIASNRILLLVDGIIKFACQIFLIFYSITPSYNCIFKLS